MPDYNPIICKESEGYNENTGKLCRNALFPLVQVGLFTSKKKNYEVSILGRYTRNRNDIKSTIMTNGDY